MSSVDYWSLYASNWEKASACVRTLAFAGIAKVWVFSMGGPEEPAVPVQLVAPIGFFAFTLLVDLLQYVLAALVCFRRLQRRPCSEQARATAAEAPAEAGLVEEAVEHPCASVPSQLCFAAKIACVGMGYAFLLRYLWEQWTTWQASG